MLAQWYLGLADRMKRLRVYVILGQLVWFVKQELKFKINYEGRIRLFFFLIMVKKFKHKNLIVCDQVLETSEVSLRQGVS